MAKKPDLRIMPDGNLGLEMDWSDIGFFDVTPARFRDVVMSHNITSGPGIDTRYMPTSRELETICDMAEYAVKHGQVIDFGYWPNDMIREVGTRGGELYTKNALGHPFSSPYVIIHSWNDPKLPLTKLLPEDMKEKKLTCSYLVNPFPNENAKELCCDFEAMQFESLIIGGQNVLGIADRIALNNEESRKYGYYVVQCIPFALRFQGSALFKHPDFKVMASNRRQDDIMHAAAGNVCDPVMVALMLLNTRGVRSETISFDKLNKSRAKSNKPLIPPYRRVDSTGYVTAIMNRVQRHSGPGIGTHASPVMHVRQGHWRHYKTGERSFVRDTLVNATQDARNEFLAGRSHYKMKPE